MPTPTINDHIRIDSVFEPLHRKTFISELAVERLVGSVLSRLSGFDERRVDVLSGKPFQHRFRDELWPMIRSQYLRRTVNADQLGEHVDDTARSDAARNIDGQTLSGVLIDHRQTLQLLPVGTSVKHEVVSPDPVLGRGRYRPQPRTGDASSRPFLRHLQASRRPDPVRSIGAHWPAAPLQKDLDTAIPEAGNRPESSRIAALTGSFFAAIREQ